MVLRDSLGLYIHLQYRHSPLVTMVLGTVWVYLYTCTVQELSFSNYGPLGQFGSVYTYTIQELSFSNYGPLGQFGSIYICTIQEVSFSNYGPVGQFRSVYTCAIQELSPSSSRL